MDLAGAIVAGVFAMAFTAVVVLLAIEQRRHRKTRRALAALQSSHDTLIDQFGRLTANCAATLQAGRYWRTSFMRLLQLVNPEMAREGMHAIAKTEVDSFLASLQQAGQRGA